MKSFIAAIIVVTAASSLHAVTPDGKQKLVLIAGKPSHPPGMHEFRAGTMLLEKCLKSVPNLVVDRHEQGWVSDEKTFEDADAVVIYADGGGKHPAVVDGHLETLHKLIAKGMGFGCMHYGVEIVPADAGKEFQAWLGGHYENAYSCNPIWDANYTELPKHPVTNGVQPFTTKDEWYFHMRFRPAFGHGVAPADDNGAKFAPILIATPSDATRDGPYVYPKGPYPHIQAEKGSPETMMWTIERADGGRGFGFTGGHFHDNWGNDNVRKAVLNALLWVSKAEVPANGVESVVTPDDLKQNLDPKNAPMPKSADLGTPRVFQRVAAR
ncbi:ThuA domain-containing protein [Prosthecobacter sp.]|uniref:ThuA domain-containing protein n=1 Tax=Prosthecobacter sp. TaxID=1965333 RepID=UPI001DC507B8|nr:ThuA domain-containing protein [Prosthecobacter sp.]MCB1277364.1 ThuA domain-containing protein [Prosthecobacter sp.]